MAAPVLASYLYGKDPSELTQNQKDTITSILNLATVTTAYTATDGSTTNAVSAAEVGKVGVEWNWLTHEENLRLKNLSNSKILVNDRLCVSEACKNIKQEIATLKAIDAARNSVFTNAKEDCNNANVQGCLAFVYVHVIQRRELTEQTYAEFLADQKNLSKDEFHKKWKTIEQDDYHQWDDNLQQDKSRVENIKLQSGGQKEVVVRLSGKNASYKNYEIVRDHTNAATYNFGQYQFTNHVSYDINPYIDYGSGPGDRTNYDIRHSGITKRLSWGDLDDFGVTGPERDLAISTFNKAAHACVVQGSSSCINAYKSYINKETQDMTIRKGVLQTNSVLEKK